MNYKQGLTVLEQAIPHGDAELTRDVALYKAQLLDNLRDEERFGETDSSRSERWRIVDKLNPLAQRLTGRSFTDLCTSASSLPQPPPPEADETWVSLSFEPRGTEVVVEWRSDFLGERTTRFTPPYDDITLPLVVKALDAVQWSSTSAGGPLFSGDEQARLAALGLWEGTWVAPQSYKLVGQQLYNALGPEGQAALNAVRNDGMLRRQRTNYVLRFPPDGVTFAALPWETLTDQGQALLLARGNAIDSCERYLLSARPLPPPLPRDQQIQILALSPTYQISEAVREQERAARLRVWEKLRDQGMLRFDEISPLTTRALSDHLRSATRPPDIVHYYGHGTYRDGQGYLLFDDGAGGRELVSAERLAAVLGDARLVVLYACQSAMVADEGGLLSGLAPAISLVSGAVVAMQLTVRVSAATRFAEVFYDELLDKRRSLQAAVAAGRQALFFEEPEGVSWFVPALYARSSEAGPIYVVAGQPAI